MLNTVIDNCAIFILDQSQNWTKDTFISFRQQVFLHKSMKHHWAIWFTVINCFFWKIFALFPFVTSPDPVLENWALQISLYY